MLQDLKLKNVIVLPITTLKVNLVESSGSLTPEELGQKQGMSVVLARYFSLICPVKQNFPLKILDVCKGRPQLKKTFSFGHCPNDGGGGSTHGRIFWPSF